MASDDQDQQLEEEGTAQQESPAPQQESVKALAAKEVEQREADIRKVHANLDELEKKLGTE
ncbi:hypothetical protein ACFU6K_32850 [Kitasatospora sp. NPDC057512]|uniref:hypothetical protein n=1 Tax=Kitasatospora sp. NPDC057512 TaxID=3346154 RepID=UPI0036A46004